MDWIKSLRLVASAMSGLLVVVGFRFAHQPINWLAVASVFVIATLAMSWNDYIDRIVDARKGKDWAYKNPKQALLVSGLISRVAIVLCAILTFEAPCMGLLSFVLLISAWVYPFTQKNPYSKNLIVSITIGGATLFPLMQNPEATSQWWLFTFVTLLFCSREYVKDIEDVATDLPDKRTLATAFGSKPAAVTAGLALIPACVIVDGALSSPWAVSFLFCASLVLILERNIRLAKLWIDLGLLVFVLSILLST